MRKKIITLLFIILISCGKPTETKMDNGIYLDRQINFEIKLSSTSGEIYNTFYISQNLKELKFDKIPKNNINLQTLTFGNTNYFKFKIDNMEEIEVCYSPTAYIIENTDSSTSVIYITYNFDYDSVKITGDAIKDVQISIKENIIDDKAYWTKNDKHYSSNC